MKYLFIILSIISWEYSFAQKKFVDPLSSTSLKIDVYNQRTILGSATGFVILKNNKYYLITNLHVVTGADYYSHAIIDSLQRIPDLLGIWHNTKILGNWLRVPELYIMEMLTTLFRAKLTTGLADFELQQML